MWIFVLKSSAHQQQNENGWCVCLRKRESLMFVHVYFLPIFISVLPDSFICLLSLQIISFTKILSRFHSFQVTNTAFLFSLFLFFFFLLTFLYFYICSFYHDRLNLDFILAWNPYISFLIPSLYLKTFLSLISKFIIIHKYWV